MKFKPVIGLEIHLELNTKYKAFSKQLIDKSAPSNTMINPYDLSFIGEKPIVNKKMVEFGYLLAKALKMDIANEIQFDRKNYFYPDLSKGFQITQFFKPIGTNGFLTIFLENNTTKDISITEIHMEEDTAKQFNKNNSKNYFDFNRSGIPLIEVVTDHKDFSEIEEVISFIEQFRELAIMLDISDAKLEEGSIRIDVNISLKEEEDLNYRNRVEIKNLNSISNIEKAIKYEIERQTKIYEEGKEVIQETKKWNEETEQTETLRIKGDDNYYSYIPETNILPFKISEDSIEEFEDIFSKAKLSYEIRKDFLDEGLTRDEISNIFSNSKFVYTFFVSILKFNKDNKELLTTKSIYNFIFGKLQGIINSLNINLYDLKFSINNIYDLIKLLEENKLNNTTLKELVIYVIQNELSKEDIDNKINEYNHIKLLKEDDILILIKDIYSKNIDKINKMNEDQKRISSLLMGLLMKQTKGKINPIEASNLIKKFLDS